MRTACIALLMLSLAACNRGRGPETKDAVRQGIVDYLAAKKFNMETMSVDVTSVQFNGTHADAVVSVAPKGGPAGSGMTMKYGLEQKDGKWLVNPPSGNPHPGAAIPDTSNPHGGGAMPTGGENPHGGAAMPEPAGGSSSMPSPDDLPPVKKK